MSVTPVFDNHQRIIAFFGDSEDEKPTGFRVADGCIFFEFNTMRVQAFSVTDRRWDDKVHPDTQAALERVAVLESDVVVLKNDTVTLKARLDALVASLGPLEPPTLPETA